MHSYTSTINDSIRQTTSEPNAYSLWVCKQISRQCDLFTLCLSWIYNKPMSNFIDVLKLYLLVEGGRSFRLDDMQRPCFVLTAHGWDSRLRASWEPVLSSAHIHFLPTLNCPSPVSHLQPDCRHHPRDWAFVIINLIHHRHHRQTSFPDVYWGTSPKEREARGP